MEAVSVEMIELARAVWRVVRIETAFVESAEVVEESAGRGITRRTRSRNSAFGPGDASEETESTAAKIASIDARNADSVSDVK